MIIREATREDSDELGAMLVELCTYEMPYDPLVFPGPGCADYLIEYTWQGVERAAGAVYFAEEGGAVAGFISGWVERRDARLWRVDRLGYIDALYVREPYRGRGAGRALMEALLTRFRAQGLSQITTDVYSANDAARGFYAGFGMRPATVKVEGPLPGAD